MKDRKYAIIDVETTGGKATYDRIIEIAIIVTDGRQILSEYQSLVYPERSIPYHITEITGIDNKMVENAPKFFEIAKNVIQHTEGCIFVAHNVRFDYNFIKEEFKSLGYPFNRKRLCTVKLTRSTRPGLRSYGLDNLIEHYGLRMENRHRAYDDTYATYQIFKDIVGSMSDTYHIDMLINEGLDASILPKGLNIDQVHDAPESPGVYYMSSASDNIMYVGKAKNIKTRIFQHFRKMSQKSMMLHQYVSKIHYEETGNELMALLLELYEIKRLRPELNKALRRTNYPYAIYQNPNPAKNKPKLLAIRNNQKHDQQYRKLKLYGSKDSAQQGLQNGILRHEICMSYVTGKRGNYICQCDLECHDLMDQSQAGYEQLTQELKYEWEEDFVLILPGRTSVEKSFVMIHDRQFWGIGYISIEESITSREQWNDHIEYQFWYPEASGIIKYYLSKHAVKKITL